MIVYWNEKNDGCCTNNRIEGQRDLELYNEIEATMGWPKHGTFLYAICRKLPYEFRCGCTGRTTPRMILVRNGEYISDVHSANLAGADFRFNSRCCYYNSPNKVGRTLWKEIVNTAESDLYHYTHPDASGNYTNGTTRGMLDDRIQMMRALRCLEYIKIELREDEIIVPRNFENFIYGDHHDDFYSVPRKMYVGFDFALTIPDGDVMKYGPCVNEEVEAIRKEYDEELSRVRRLSWDAYSHINNLYKNKEEANKIKRRWDEKHFPKKPASYGGIWEEVKITRV